MLSKFKKTGKHALPLALGLLLFLAAPAQAVELRAEAPPGADEVLRVIRWIIWGADIVLFAIWIHGIIKAADKRRHGEADVSAAVWPIVGVIVVTIGNGIWSAIAGI